jgi:hypothetical protein
LFSDIATVDLSTAANTADDAANDASKDEETDDGKHNDHPCLELEAAVAEQRATAVVIVEHGTIRADGTDTKLRARFRVGDIICEN